VIAISFYHRISAGVCSFWRSRWKGKKEGGREWKREHLFNSRAQKGPGPIGTAEAVVDDFRYVPANFWKRVGQLHNFILWAYLPDLVAAYLSSF